MGVKRGRVSERGMSEGGGTGVWGKKGEGIWGDWVEGCWLRQDPNTELNKLYCFKSNLFSPQNEKGKNLIKRRVPWLQVKEAKKWVTKAVKTSRHVMRVMNRKKEAWRAWKGMKRAVLLWQLVFLDTLIASNACTQMITDHWSWRIRRMYIHPDMTEIIALRFSAYSRNVYS